MLKILIHTDEISKIDVKFLIISPFKIFEFPFKILAHFVKHSVVARKPPFRKSPDNPILYNPII